MAEPSPFEREFHLNAYRLHDKVEEFRKFLSETLSAQHFRLANLDNGAVRLVVDHRYYDNEKPRTICASRVYDLFLRTPEKAAKFEVIEIVPMKGPMNFHDLYTDPDTLPVEGLVVSLYLEDPRDHGQGYVFAVFQDGGFHFHSSDSDAWDLARMAGAIRVAWHEVAHEGIRFSPQ